MNDDQQPTAIDLLVDRLSRRIGQLTAENEWLRLQLEQAQQDQPLAATNGEHQEVAVP